MNASKPMSLITLCTTVSRSGFPATEIILVVISLWFEVKQMGTSAWDTRCSIVSLILFYEGECLLTHAHMQRKSSRALEL